jgi:3-mercaptopyruvate sulfurtransferase SseA
MRLISSFVAIAILALGVLTACNSAEQSKSARPTPVAATPVPADGARRITVAELKDLLAKDEAVVIDVRDEASYNTAHIKGAKTIPEAQIANRLDELPRNKFIVTYCS